jgi:hydrogenase maturation protease
LEPGGAEVRRTLVVGFGNPFRRDDGVGSAVGNVLLERLGRPPLLPLEDGFDRLGHEVDIIQVHQLVPELSETVAGYDLLILVDAHVGAIEEPVMEQRIDPSLRVPLIAHQTHPSSLLALSQQMYGRAPEAVLLSLRGHDFGFGEGLSVQTAALVPAALSRIMEMIQAIPA